MDKIFVTRPNTCTYCFNGHFPGKPS